jgi:hypothetical protein
MINSGNGRHAVKLSDIFEKATGESSSEIDSYRRIFDDTGMTKVPVIV